MAAFLPAFEAVITRFEGGYVNDPDDPGGETYRGIARRGHPNWPGWSIVDAAKGRPDFPACLEKDASLQSIVRGFYKARYWDAFWGDALPDAIAVELFDQAVHIGPWRAIEHLQRALNVLNRNGKLYDDLVVDGVFGARTLDALNVLVGVGDEGVLIKTMNILQGAYYLSVMRSSARLEKYARGWLSRVTFSA